MKYDFDTVVDRKGSGSLKWDVSDGELPMWVADMDFLAAPPIREALEKRARHGIFGYSQLPGEWYDSYIGWWKRRHNLKLSRDWLVFCTGIVPALSSAVRKLTTPAEKVVIQPPVYNLFYNSIINNGRQVLESPLVCSGGEYSMDFGDLEKKLSDPQATLMILCNPQNPAGRIWSKEELRRVAELCHRHGVILISDEIHCDLTDPDVLYTPFASVSDVARDISVTCVAPTKTFNIAGLQTAAVFSANPFLRHKMWRALNTDEVAEPNAFAVDATVAAFTRCGDWLDELREYIYQNKQVVKEFLEEKLPKIRLVKSKATYLLWLDCSEITADSSELARVIREKTGLFLSSGGQYGSGGECFLRMNIACPRERLLDGLSRLDRALN